jgi:hypothetical protein
MYEKIKKLNIELRNVANGKKGGNNRSMGDGLKVFS